LAGPVAGDADTSDFANAGAGGHDIFYFIGIDVESGHQDHVFLAVDDIEKAVFVHAGNIAAAEKAVTTKTGAVVIGASPVTGHDLRPGDAQFAGFALWQIFAG